LAAALEAGHDLSKALALDAADQAVGLNRVVVEEELGRLDPVVAELCQLWPDPEARALLGEEQRHAAMPRLGRRVGLDQKREAGSADAVGDPGLGAVDQVVLALAHGARPDRLQVGAGVGLGQRQPAPELAGRKAGQEGLLLGAGAEALDDLGHDQMGVEVAGQRDPDLGDHGDDPGIGQRRQAEPAMFGRNGRAEQAERLHLLDQLGRATIRPLELRHARADVALEPAPDRVEDRSLLGSGTLGQRFRPRAARCPGSCPRPRGRAWGSAWCA
jgi:hypothetical protein